MLGAVAQFEKSITVDKLRAARERQRRENGRCEGRKAYGDRLGERAIIERIWQLRRRRPNGHAMTTRDIAEKLTEEGHPTRTGGPWCHGVIAGILKRRRRSEPKPTKRAETKAQP